MIIKICLDKNTDKELYEEMKKVPLKRRATRLRILAIVGIASLNGGNNITAVYQPVNNEDETTSEDKKDLDRTSNKEMRTKKLLKESGMLDD